MTRMTSAALIALLATQAVYAAPGDIAHAKPTVACPQTQLGDDVLQSQYDELWRTYGEKVATATKAVEDELTRLFEAAKSDGNLDLALFWHGLKKTLAETGQLRWEPMSQKKDWKRFGEAEFPDGLASILSQCEDSYGKARDELKQGYKALEEALTKVDKLELALAIRKEFEGLWGTASPSQAEPAVANVVDPIRKPAIAKTVDLIPLVQLQGPGTTGIWRIVGRTVHGGSKEAVKTPISIDVPEEYDFVVTFIVAEGGQVNMSSSAPKTCFHWEMRMWPNEMPVFGFVFDGKSGKNNRTSVTWPKKLPKGGTHESILQVRRDGITALFDGQVVSQVTRELCPTLGVPELWHVGENRLGLSCWNSSVIFQRVALKAVDR